MALHTLKEYYPNYQDDIGNGELKNIDSYKVYTEGENQIGSVKDLLVDDSGRFRYAIIDTGPWIFGKDVLLPIGLAQFDHPRNYIYVDGLSRKQVEDLPEYQRDRIVDEDYENHVREQYRPIAQRRSNRQYIEDSATMSQSVDSSTAVESSAPVGAETTANRQNTIYDREPAYYGLSEQDNQRPLKLYEERLVTNRHREKVGEVRIGKHVETETAEVSEPIEKERVVVERRDAQGRPSTGSKHQFNDEEVARMDVYEERIDVEKQPYVAEEVNIRKESKQETARSKEKIHREELDIDTKGDPNIRQ